MAATTHEVPLIAVLGWFAFCGILAIVWLIFDRRRKKERKLQFAVFAAKQGLTAYEDMQTASPLNPFDDYNDVVTGSVVGGDLCRMLSSFSPFDDGCDKAVTNAATRDVGFGTFYMFDYSVTLGESHKSRYNYGVVVFRVPFYFSRVEITPSSPALRVVEKVVTHPVEFESDEFNRNYLVEADNPKFAFDVLHAQTMNYLLALPRLSWQLKGPYIVITKFNPFEFSTVRELIPTVQKFIELLPDYVRDDIGFTPRWTSLFESAL